MNNAEMPDQGASSQRRRRHSPAEWITLLIAAVVVAVGYSEFTRGDAPPACLAEVRTADARADADRFDVPVTVTNTGDQPAQEIRVRVELHSGEASESAVFTLDLLAAGASDDGVAVFTHDPATSEVRAVVESLM